MADNELGKRLRELWGEVKSRADWPADFQETIDQALLVVNAAAPVCRDLARIASAFATQADQAEKTLAKVEQVTTTPDKLPDDIGADYRAGYVKAMGQVRAALGKGAG